MILSWQTYLDDIQLAFTQNRNNTYAVKMAAYMKGHFTYLGINSPLRKELLKSIKTRHGKPSIDQLKHLLEWSWDQDYREFQYAAMDIAGTLLKKTDPSFLPVYQDLIQRKSWWDTVDWLAPNGCGTILRGQEKLINQYPDKWIKSENIWLQRSAILFQLKYRGDVEEKRLFSYIIERRKSKEFFVQKAMGWALREFSKWRPEIVVEFIQSETLPPLTKREGLKWLKNKGKIET